MLQIICATVRYAEADATTNQTYNLTTTMIKNALLVALLASAMPAIAGTPSKNPVTPPPPPPAKKLSYDNVTAGYSRAIDAEADAIGAGVSASFTENLFGTAGIGFAGVSGLDNFSANVNVGGHVPLATDFDLVATAGVLFSVPDEGDDDAFFTASAGFRTFLGPVDAFIGATYVDANDGIWQGNIALWVPVAAKFDIGIGAAMNLEETDDWSLSGGFRYRFK